ncbi:DUF4198 domain-containing protein [Aestuariibius sp. 2305UL40-4]|uniref:DUF4198 domain-containing protein n=1 Tax=Aestuariibius violaceus TaxID=3234132 RepID=UPI00345E5AEE
MTRTAHKLTRIEPEVFMRILTVLFTLLIAGPAAAHEFWLEPQEYQVETGGMLAAQVVNGEKFEGVKLAYFPQRFARFDVVSGGEAAPYEGRAGDTPALQLEDPPDGLLTLVYVSKPASLRYEAFEKFQTFADHKDFANIEARHRDRGLPMEDFTESYTRFARSIVAVGDGTGADAPSGIETEIVALANPYVEALTEMPVQVFYQGAPRTDVQVELFAKAPDGSVAVTLHRTDAEGIARLPVRPGHSYLADAVVLREPSEAALDARADAVWETLWASLTFAVPAETPPS